MPVSQRDEHHAQAVPANDRSRGTGVTARAAGLTQEFLRDRFVVAWVIFSWLFVGQVAELTP
jgi:hypothetical protein